jgi:hypothetical protein
MPLEWSGGNGSGIGSQSVVPAILAKLLCGQTVLCPACMSKKAAFALSDIEPTARRFELTFVVNCGVARCTACKQSTLVYSAVRYSSSIGTQPGYRSIYWLRDVVGVKGSRGGRAMAEDVSAVILAKIKSGTLPSPADRSGKSYAGKGTDKACDGCDRTVTRDDVEYEIDVADDRTLRFHEHCFAMWQDA